MTDFDYKKYSLENLEKWMSDALISAEATPQEIYDVIKGVVDEEYHYFKHQTSRCYELLALLNGNGNFSLSEVLKEREYYEGIEHKLVCDKDDKSPECQNAWNDFWEESSSSEEHQKHNEEVKDDGMRPWGHSDLEYLIANPTLTEDRISNFPGEQYSEEELNAMCAAAEDKEKCREYNLREAEYYDKRAQLDAEQNDIFNNVFDSRREDKVVKWQLPVEVDGISGEYYIQFPDDLMEAAGIKEDDLVEWIDRKDGSFELRKVTKPIGMEEC
jgi:hypothetical protein